MSEARPTVNDFTVSIDERHQGRVFVLWPCNAATLYQFVNGRFGLDPGDRNTWEGKCYFSAELDELCGQPSVVIALRTWDLNLKDPRPEETNSEQLSVLAHECFHAAEWMLKQTGQEPPVAKSGEQWEAWEDAAYLLQRIMRHALEGMLKRSGAK